MGTNFTNYQELIKPQIDVPKVRRAIKNKIVKYTRIFKESDNFMVGQLYTLLICERYFRENLSLDTEEQIIELHKSIYFVLRNWAEYKDEKR